MVAAAVLTTLLGAQTGGGAAGVPAPVPSAPSPVELLWEAPAGCPDAETVRAGIERGIPTPPAGVATMRAGVAVTQLDDEHWRATLELRGVDWTATRTLKGPTCAAVSDAAGLVIVLALATELREREVVVAPPPPPPAPPASPRSSPTLGFSATGDEGALPNASPGAAVIVGWRFARARVDLRGGWFASRRGTVPGHPDTGANLSVISTALRGCYLRGDRVSLGPCALAGVDRFAGTGFGPITAADAANVAPFLGAGLQGEWRLSRWVVAFLSAEAAIPLVRAQFSVKDIGPVHQAAAVSFRGAVGLELRFR
jgi:hypothetical protein